MRVGGLVSGMRVGGLVSGMRVRGLVSGMRVGGLWEGWGEPGYTATPWASGGSWMVRKRSTSGEGWGFMGINVWGCVDRWEKSVGSVQELPGGSALVKGRPASPVFHPPLLYARVLADGKHPFFAHGSWRMASTPSLRTGLGGWRAPNLT
eukprot:283387-Chlamydomonas_euryale.AAC.3